MADRTVLRLAATLLVIGVVMAVVFFLLHPQGAENDQATFGVFAKSASWTAIHLGEFVGLAIILAGLLVLFVALNVVAGPPRWAGFYAAVAAGVTMALAGVAFAVDGVALKQAVDAWASAPAAEQATLLASAQAIQWLELGTKSYQDLMFGLTLLLFATTIVWTASLPRPLGSVLGVIGLVFIAVGWLEGTVGFSATYGVLVLLGYLLLLPVWSIWLLIVAWRRKESGQTTSGRAIPSP